jgi:dTDP-4-dehydrorhamnose 3,5-epimerase
VGRALRNDNAEIDSASVTLVETGLAGVLLAEPVTVPDGRGFFARLYDEGELADRGVDTRISQSRIAFNESAATLRGLHYQAAPHGETKIVRCTAGAIYDVVADLRPGSPTLHRWRGFELSSSNRSSLIVPPGCAHGYLTLTPGAEVFYVISVPYVEAAQRGVRFDDPTLAVMWPREPRVIGERDAALPLLEA